MSQKILTVIEEQKKILVMVLSALGLLVSLYIHFVIETGNIAHACKIGQHIDCTDVVNSVYGHFLGIPWSLYGAFYFVVFLALYFVDYYDDYVMAGLVFLGLISVANFLYIEYILGAICLYCTTVHIIVILLSLLIGPKAIKNSYQKLKKIQT